MISPGTVRDRHPRDRSRSLVAGIALVTLAGCGVTVTESKALSELDASELRGRVRVFQVVDHRAGGLKTADILGEVTRKGYRAEWSSVRYGDGVVVGEVGEPLDGRSIAPDAAVLIIRAFWIEHEELEKLPVLHGARTVKQGVCASLYRHEKGLVYRATSQGPWRTNYSEGVEELEADGLEGLGALLDRIPTRSTSD